MSDHDSVKNHARVKALSDQRGVGMIPSLEVSPGWGHFNVLPMPLGGAVVDPGLTPREIFARVRRKKGLVFVNHPHGE